MDAKDLNQIEGEKLTPQEKKKQLFLKQKKLLETFFGTKRYLYGSV